MAPLPTLEENIKKIMKEWQEKPQFSFSTPKVTSKECEVKVNYLEGKFEKSFQKLPEYYFSTPKVTRTEKSTNRKHENEAVSNKQDRMSPITETDFPVRSFLQNTSPQFKVSTAPHCPKPNKFDFDVCDDPTSSFMNDDSFGSFEALNNDNFMKLNSIPLSLDMSDDDSSSSGRMSSGNSPLPKKANFSNMEFHNYETLYTSNIGATDISANYETFSLAEKSYMSMKSSCQDTKSFFMNDSKCASGKSINLSITHEQLSESLYKSNKLCTKISTGITRSRRDMNKWGNVSVFSCFEDKNGTMLHQSNQTPQPFSYFNKTYPSRKLIGNGHFADAFKVDCNRFGKSAIKKLSKPRSQFYKEKEVFNHEILGKHLNVVEFFLAWVEDSILFIQMELCEFSCNGLKTFLTSCIDNSNTQWVFLADCSRGLQHLHAHNILHLDVKPANILLGSDYYFKLGDFGCSAKNEEQFVIGEHVDGNFEAPELARRIVSNKADVYALGECVKTLTCENVDNCDADLASVVERMKKCDYMERPNASAICNCKEITVRNIAQFRMDIQATLEPVIEERAKEEQKKKVY